jgi:four helix bundle protein
MKKKNAITELSLDFAIRIIEYSEQLQLHRKFVISKQLLSSGTSIGANIREAQEAESRMDFIHKMKIAAKEASETEYWLTICDSISGYPPINELMIKLIEIRKILSRIIFTSKSNIEKK